MRELVRYVLKRMAGQFGPCVAIKAAHGPLDLLRIMENKNFLIYGLISLTIIVGMTFMAVRKEPPSNSVEETQVLGQDDLVESAEQETMQTETGNLKQYSSAPQMQLNEGVDYKARMVTNKGEILIDLFEEESPITVNNFVFLAREGFYDGIIFHRVIKDFMIQGGDPLGVGVGGPGYKFEDEFNDVKLVEGSLAMANSGPNTNGSQFFIVTLAETPWLDGLHTNFGQVIEGLDIVHEIENVQTGPNDKPVEDVVIQSIEIIEE